MFINFYQSKFGLLLIPLLLIGCAAPQYKTTYQTRENGTVKYYESTKETYSIRSVNISGSGILTLDGYRTSFMVEYEGPNMEEITKVRRPADPVGALVNTAATVGLNLLFAPKKTGSQAIGDTQNEYVSRTYIDKSRSKTTGRGVWETKAEIFNGSVLIYGVSETVIDIYVKNNYLDISNYLKATKFKNPLNITIVCKYCGELKIVQNSDFANFTRQKNINYDLRIFQAEQSVDYKVKKSTLENKSTSNAEQRCSLAGLRTGSADFNKCVNTLK